MRCPDCNKFVGLEMGDPEVDIEVSDEGHVSGSVRVVRNCAECGTELKEATFDIDTDDAEEAVEKHLKEKPGADHSLDAEEETTAEESGGSRYKKNMISATVNYTVRCTWQEEPVYEGSWTDEIAASHMDELA